MKNPRELARAASQVHDPHARRRADERQGTVAR
jgi:hypothetical protein